MGWRDRDYNQTRFGGGPNSRNPLWFLLMGSIPLGTWLGIRLRVHMSLVLLIAFNLLMAETATGLGIQNALASSIILFSIVLLHEFGHCLTARAVGGSAEEILLWPLGGLASIDTPRRPWPTFAAAAGGPLVNVIICVGIGITLWVLSNFKLNLPLNPLYLFADGRTLPTYLTEYPTLARYLWWTYSLSWSILFFNLLPFFPMDGGRILQAILWPIIGYRKAMNVACIVGMVGAGIMAMVGMVSWNPILVFIAISGFMTCYQMRAMLQAQGEEEWSDESAYESHPHKRLLKPNKSWMKKAARKAAQDRADQAKIDAILDKVHEKGLHSLTWREKRLLKQATERQREQDLVNKY